MASQLEGVADQVRRSLKTFSGRRASQSAFELKSFTDLLKSYDVRNYLEIGARHGDTFHHIMTCLPSGSKGVAIDLPGGMWGKKTTRQYLESAVSDLKARGYQVSSLFGDSTTPAIETIARGRGPYDAILIDGDHRYDGVKADWIRYGKLAPIVAFHDIVGEGQAERVHGNLVEVPRLWKEIKEAADGYSCVEFVEEGSTMGIGVVIRD